MKNDYLCPKCKGHLNINGKVAFLVVNLKKEKGIVFLSPELGNYTSEKHETFIVEHGEEVDVFCPICHENLMVTSDKHRFIRVIMLEDAKQSNVLFSHVFGEKSTYKVDVDDYTFYGEQQDDGIDFETLSLLI